MRSRSNARMPSTRSRSHRAWAHSMISAAPLMACVGGAEARQRCGRAGVGIPAFACTEGRQEMGDAGPGQGVRNRERAHAIQRLHEQDRLWGFLTLSRCLTSCFSSSLTKSILLRSRRSAKATCSTACGWAGGSCAARGVERDRWMNEGRPSVAQGQQAVTSYANSCGTMASTAAVPAAAYLVLGPLLHLLVQVVPDVLGVHHGQDGVQAHGCLYRKGAGGGAVGCVVYGQSAWRRGWSAQAHARLSGGGTVGGLQRSGGRRTDRCFRSRPYSQPPPPPTHPHTFRSLSTKKVWATGAGSASPVVSIRMASNLGGAEGSNRGSGKRLVCRRLVLSRLASCGQRWQPPALPPGTLLAPPPQQLLFTMTPPRFTCSCASAACAECGSGRHALVVVSGCRGTREGGEGYLGETGGGERFER